MEFPEEIYDGAHWKIVKMKTGAVLWLEFPTGEEKRIGTKTAYQRIINPNEKILEINVFQKGVVAQMWFPNLKSSTELFYSRILKDGKWINGLPNSPVDLISLRSRVDGKFSGVQVLLRIIPDRIETVDILE